ncbi:hypothetical protein FA15DRAFT_459439 [Coprinopsis marcescibilis]|uniref:Uncharacterized protein n=1 Tax=Coprinopsis marcescibilis TaxID=230819 RepID=A0A5C3KUU1_COPMA|nr:hypothetical protein FA15DRAFT_459439 [Coprinopsis marcescibilis]
MSNPNGQILAIAFTTAGVEGILNGTFIVLCLTALYLLIYRSPNRASKRPRLLPNLSRPLVYGSMALLIIIVSHWSCTMARVVEISMVIGRGDSPTTFLDGITDPLAIAKTLFLVLAGLVSDALLMWRLWVVSDRNRYVVIPPILTWLILLVTTLRVGAFYIQVSKEPSVQLPEISRWIQVIGFATIFTNVYCAESEQSPSSATMISSSFLQTQFLLVIIVEGAVVWGAWTVFVFVAYHTNSPLINMAFDGCPAAAGIAFMLINVRVGLGRDTNPTMVNRVSGPPLPTFAHSTTSDSSSIPSFKMAELASHKSFER